MLQDFMNTLTPKSLIDIDKIRNEVIEKIEKHEYLGHNMKLRLDNQTAEIKRRIGFGWAAFGKLLCSEAMERIMLAISLRDKMTNEWIRSVRTNWITVLMKNMRMSEQQKSINPFTLLVLKQLR